MKTKNIVATYRNAATPAARLAAWQTPGCGNRPSLAGNLHKIRESMVSPYGGNPTLAQARRALIDAQGPELSGPGAESPLLWVSERSPEVLDAHAGREFLDHRGWYTDDVMQDETFETYAVRLARFPRIMFYAVLDSCNGDFRVMLEDWEEIDFSDAESSYHAAGDCIQEAARSVVRSNDSSTEREAEESREYYRKDRAERDIAENRETLAGLRSEIRDLCRELKTLCPSPLAGEYPAAGKALRRALASLLSDRRDLMETNETLAASI